MSDIGEYLYYKIVNNKVSVDCEPYTLSQILAYLYLHNKGKGCIKWYPNNRGHYDIDIGPGLGCYFEIIKKEDTELSNICVDEIPD